MICWMSEGITVRAELPRGMAHAAALNISRTQIPLLTVFIITTSKEYVRLDAVYPLIVCQSQGRKAKRKGTSRSKEGAWPAPLRSLIKWLFCGFPQQTPHLSTTPD